MVLKAKKDAPSPPKAEAKAKARKLRGGTEWRPQPQNEDPHITRLRGPKTPVASEAGQIPSEERAQKKQAWPPCHHQIPQTMKKTGDNSTLMFTVDVKANKHQIKQAMEKL